MHYIYTLTDPTNHEVYYVGQTVHVINRKSAHLNGHHEGRSGRKTAGILATNQTPIFTVIDELQTAHLELALRYEACWRAQLRLQGVKLLNDWHTGIIHRDTTRPLEDMEIIKKFALCDDINLYHEFEARRGLARLTFEF